MGLKGFVKKSAKVYVALAILGFVLTGVYFGYVQAFGEQKPAGYAEEDNPSPDGKVINALNRTQIENSYHNFINDKRKSEGYTSLSIHSTVRLIAREKSEDMVVNGYFENEYQAEFNSTEALIKRAKSCTQDLDGSRIYPGAVFGYTYADSDVDASYKQGIVDYNNNETRIGRGLGKSIWNSSDTREIVLNEHSKHGVGVVIQGSDQNGTRVMLTDQYCG